jgi:aryl-alcohol dehydrogenase-like predicted oxidoreductase
MPVTPSPFALGTISWGTKLSGTELDRLYDTFRASGGNVFDSAHVYACWLPGGAGASERALGEIVRRRGDRDRVFLATKGGHPTFRDVYARPDHYLAPEVIERDVNESLDRLGFDVIDLYFLHRDDPRVPVGEIMDVLDEQVRRGRLRQVGASNWTTSRVAGANAYAASRGRVQLVASQVKFSLAVPQPSKDPLVPPFEQTDVDWHARTKLPVYAYSPTANGFFATNGERGGRGWHGPVSDARLREANRLATVVRATPNQVALAWLLHQPFPVIPILGTTNVDHLQDAMGAAAVRLTLEQMRSLDRPGA